MRSLPYINWYVPQSFDDLQFQNDTLNYETLVRTKLFSGTYGSSEGFGIVDTVDPASISSADNNRSLQVSVNSSILTRIDINQAM